MIFLLKVFAYSIALHFKWVFDKCALVFASFKDIIMSVASPLAEFLNSIWQGIGDFFYSIFSSLFEWFASKLSWVGDMISSISGFIKDALENTLQMVYVL